MHHKLWGVLLFFHALSFRKHPERLGKMERDERRGQQLACMEPSKANNLEEGW